MQFSLAWREKKRIHLDLRFVIFQPTMEDDSTPSPPPDPGDDAKISVAPADATCWMCLEGGHDLQRSCACRGPSAGYAHVDCIASYAEAKLEESLYGSHSQSRVAYLDAHTQCPLCNKAYTGKMLRMLSTKLVAALEHLPISDIRRATAIYLKAGAYLKKEPKKAANEFRSLLVEENTCLGLKMKALVFLTQIEHREGNADKVMMYLSIVDDFYGAHLSYFQEKGIDPDMLGLRTIKEDIITAISGSLPPSYYATNARELQTALETPNLSAEEKDIIQERLMIILARSEQYVEALQLSKRVLDDHLREFGPNHIRTRRLIVIVDNLKEKYRVYLERHK